MEEDKDIELRSEEVQEILTRVPHWMIRWGNVVILVLLLFLLLISWIVKYPDLIAAQISLTTTTPPERLIARTSGRIEAILVKDNTVINQKTPLAVIENSGNYIDIFKLKNAVEQFQNKNAQFNFGQFQNAQFGEIEAAYSLFQKESTSSKLNTQLRPYEVKGNAQSKEVQQISERLALYESQKTISQSELVIEKKNLQRYEALYTKGVIAMQELENNKLKYYQLEKNYKSLLTSISQLQSTLNDLRSSYTTTQIDKTINNVSLDRNKTQAFYALKKAIKDWELQYIIQSSIDGTVSFLQVWKDNQTVTAGDQVFSIIPSNQKEYIGKMKAPLLNSGKLRTGQMVNIRLINYPDREFGIIKGIVKKIALVPDREGNLLIDVSLPNGLATSYNKKIVFQQEMAGTADIVTEDLRLIERLLYQFRDLFTRENFIEQKTQPTKG
jgi:multidrug resistance efflux pump